MVEDRYSCSNRLVRAEKIARGLGLSGIESAISESRATFRQDGIYEALGKIDPEDAREALQQFYGRMDGETEDFFPNGLEIADFLVDLMKARWNNPDRVYGRDEIEDLTRAITKNMRLVAGKIGIVEGLSIPPNIEYADTEMRKSRDNMKEDIRERARKYGRGVQYHLAGNDALRILQVPTKFIEDVVNTVGYIVSSDIPRLREDYPSNPFMPLVSMEALGLTPLGIVDKKFLIHHPRVEK